MVPFRFQRLELPDVIVIEPTVFEDDRGMFMEVYRASDFLRASCATSHSANDINNPRGESDRGRDRGTLGNNPDPAFAGPTSRPRLSARDAALPPLRAADNDF